jgi:hypothetical protein
MVSNSLLSGRHGDKAPRPELEATYGVPRRDLSTVLDHASIQSKVPKTPLDWQPSLSWAPEIDPMPGHPGATRLLSPEAVLSDSSIQVSGQVAYTPLIEPTAEVGLGTMPHQ